MSEIVADFHRRIIVYFCLRASGLHAYNASMLQIDRLGLLFLLQQNRLRQVRYQMPVLRHEFLHYNCVDFLDLSEVLLLLVFAHWRYLLLCSRRFGRQLLSLLQALALSLLLQDPRSILTEVNWHLEPVLPTDLCLAESHLGQAN